MHKQQSNKEKGHKHSLQPVIFDTQFFKVKLEVNFHQLKIEMMRLITQELYEYSITQETIENSPELSVIYPDPEALFQDLRKNYSELLVTEDGVITLEISLKVLGKVSKKQIKFYAKKRVGVTMEQLNLLAAQHFRQIEVFKAEHARQIDELRREIEIIKTRLNTYEPSPKQQNYGMNFTQLGIYEENNENKKYFTVKKLERSIKVIRNIYDGTYRNFVLNISVPKERNNVVAITQIKTKSASIRYGVVTKSLVSGRDTLHNKESIQYNGGRGGYYVISKEYFKGSAIKDGANILMSIDTFNWTVGWNVTAPVPKDSFAVETYIPEELKAVDLFVCVAIMDEGDEIEMTIAE